MKANICILFTAFIMCVQSLTSLVNFPTSFSFTKAFLPDWVSLKVALGLLDSAGTWKATKGDRLRTDISTFKLKWIYHWHTLFVKLNTRKCCLRCQILAYFFLVDNQKHIACNNLELWHCGTTKNNYIRPQKSKSPSHWNWKWNSSWLRSNLPNVAITWKTHFLSSHMEIRDDLLVNVSAERLYIFSGRSRTGPPVGRVAAVASGR